MNLPNVLTVLRILLTFIFIYMIGQEGVSAKIYASLIFAAAALTDFFDGYYARKHNLITNFGKVMDPIADKFLMLSAFFIFSQGQIIPGWMFWVIFIREAGITVWRFWAMKKGRVLAAENLGKFKTVAQIMAVCIILIYIIFHELHPNHALAYVTLSINIIMLITIGLTLFSGGSYVWNNIRQVR